MVIVSSGIAELTAPGVTGYCSTKSFQTSLGHALHFEMNTQNVDVMVWEPYEVDTKMTAKQKSKGKLSTKNAVEGAFRFLGKTRFTDGAMKHDFQSLFMWMFPIDLIGGKFAQQTRDLFIKEQKEREMQNMQKNENTIQ